MATHTEYVEIIDKTRPEILKVYYKYIEMIQGIKANHRWKTSSNI